MFFTSISFKKDFGSFSSEPFAFIRGELDDTSSVFRVVFNGISLY